VPDNILNNADEVVLVDLPPKELQKRLKEGKIYKADKTEAALNNFFTEGNLTALREMALRYTAERVDRQMTGFMHAHGIKGPLSNRERMMVCIDDDINSEELIRHASRIAKRNKISLLCVYVDNGNIGPLSNNQLQRSLKLAEQVGGEAITLTGADIADEIISFAKSRDINHILVGKAKSKWHSILNNSIADQLLKKSDDIEITIIPLEEIQAKKTSHNITAPKFRYIDFVYSSSMVIVASILAYALSSEFSSHNLSLIFLSASVFTAILFSSIYGIYSVIIGFSIFNHLFVSSKIGYFALRSEEMIKFGFYMLIVFITSHLASKIKNQVHMVKQQAEHLTLLYEFTKKVAEATNSISVYKAIVENAIAIAGDDAVILMPSDEAKLEVIIGPTDLGEVAYAAANWCFNNNEPAGYSSDTLSACKWAFLPMNTDIGTIGILGIYFDKTDNSLLFSQQRMLNLLVDQAAIAVERESLSNKNNVEDSMPTLFSSIALEAQEPINLLIEKINQLKKDKIHIGNDIRLELLDKIRREAENLNVMINAIINQNEENS
jgi:two-component system sensor histidine kinase KdpD